MINFKLTLIFTVILLTGMSISRLACGEDAQGPPLRVSVNHEGLPGVWFRADVAQTMIAASEELPGLRQEVQLLGEQLQLREDMMDRLRQIVDLARAATDRALDGLRVAVASVSSDESPRDVWWRSPILWSVVGVVAAVLLEVAAVAIFEYVSSE